VGKYCKAGHSTDVNVIWRMRFAYWINKSTDTHSESVIFIAFPRQQWLRERAAVSCCTYIECLVKLQVRVTLLLQTLNPFHSLFTN